jgi:pimeloyl-ACP methyl ester carboxylesterase
METIHVFRQSHFKDNEKDLRYFEQWIKRLEKHNGRNYHHLEFQTPLGKTSVRAIRDDQKNLPALVVFPGARTTPLIWDLDKGLDHLGNHLRIYLVETNGLPNDSDGSTPDIKGNGYGIWAKALLDQLELKTCFIAGASFGGNICCKLSIVAPERIEKMFLLNPGCLQSFSMSMKNLYYNILPLVASSEKNVRKFLDKAVFCKPNHQLSPEAEQLLVDYEVFAISRYKDRTQKPYFMQNELPLVRVETHVLLGNQDLLFPRKKSENNAKQLLSSLKHLELFDRVGHGIELYPPALEYIHQHTK